MELRLGLDLAYGLKAWARTTNTRGLDLVCGLEAWTSLADSRPGFKGQTVQLASFSPFIKVMCCCAVTGFVMGGLSSLRASAAPIGSRNSRTLTLRCE